MFDFLKNIFGTKSEKDIKNLDSKVEEINEIFTSLNSISNNDLRAKTTELKIAIQSAVKTQNERITAIKTQINSDLEMDINTKEDLYKEIDVI